MANKNFDWRISRAFIEKIEDCGFYRSSINDSRYYIDIQGHQLKIDVSTNLISLIDKKGFTLLRDESVSEEDFQNFMNDKF